MVNTPPTAPPLATNTATMAANTVFLDGETPLTKARTSDDIAQLGVTVDKKIEKL